MEPFPKFIILCSLSMALLGNLPHGGIKTLLINARQLLLILHAGGDDHVLL